MRLLRSVFYVLAAGCVMAGCGATIHQQHYIVAADPVVGSTNYFRVTIHGQISFSEAKYSVGFYDRDAVERLFGEAAFDRLYVAKRLSLFGLTTKEKLAELDAALEKARALVAADRQEQIEIAIGFAQGVLQRYEVDLKGDLSTRFTPLIAKGKVQTAAAREALKLAKGDVELDKLAEAQGLLAEVNAIVQGIRVAVDGDVLVRFFDGAGNEIDVAGRTLVIFVASDAGRFAEALKQLAESEEATQNLIYAVMGDQIQEAEWIARQYEMSETKRAVENERLAGIVDPLATLPDDDGKATAALTAAIQAAASTVSGGATTFGSAKEIEDFAKGLSGGTP
jgi:hypothetical protein